ncbi:alpha/beta hydrolase [Zunongwangia endophytica]|uniref:Alpha/beta hydrolase n=1 Tax=Zunongwangia endophytica TaxID=1808945 RepID=A0ABV8H9T2_9FLAO|nr:alpha/beta fold hydrolase [Zunongwangia endophytica]MDN3594974.1 alpha/beta hydrolase [Zunongwangia endophytica]
MKKILFILSILSINFCFAQFEDKDIEVNKYVHGTICEPSEKTEVAALIIAGSGPTDRDGNIPVINNHSLEMLAHGLAENNIASFRYDKRIFRLGELNLTEADLSFEDFIEDAVTGIHYLKDTLGYKKIVVIGHSQGSLVGMIAAKDRASGFISLAGPSEKMSTKIIEQVTNQSPAYGDTTRVHFQELQDTDTIKKVNPFLMSIFRPSVQQFIKSWDHYEPKKEIQELSIPILIINGDKDKQVSIEDAKALKIVVNDAELLLLKNMNHVLKSEAETRTNEEGELIVHPELIPALTKFIQEL